MKFLLVKLSTLFLCVSFYCSAEVKPTICLNMIVKNESQVITRCLSSVLSLIDSWVIVDTGSTDGTQQIIRDFMKEKQIPGELHERSWVNFAHNRNEAMELARGKADYLLFIDADEYFIYSPDFKLPKLDKDYYYVTIDHSGSTYPRIHLINNKLAWRWEGVLHEVLTPSGSWSSARLENVINVTTAEGARSKDPQKYLRDAETLEEALKKEPNHPRYRFYLAQSYRDAKLLPQALENYEKRASQGGWEEEVFWSLYQIGLIQESLQMPTKTVLASFRKAYEYRPSRIEPLYQIAHYLTERRNFELGYRIAKIALTVPESSDLLFVQSWMHRYGALLELSICAYWLGKYEECQQISSDLLKRDDLPANVRSCVEKNLGFANAKLLNVYFNHHRASEITEN